MIHQIIEKKIIDKATWKSLWINICMGKASFQSCIKWKVGEGNRVSFWLDTWLKGGARDQYPQIFDISQQKDMMVYESFRDIRGELRSSR